MDRWVESLPQWERLTSWGWITYVNVRPTVFGLQQATSLPVQEDREDAGEGVTELGDDSERYEVELDADAHYRSDFDEVQPYRARIDEFAVDHVQPGDSAAAFEPQTPGYAVEFGSGRLVPLYFAQDRGFLIIRSH